MDLKRRRAIDENDTFNGELLTLHIQNDTYTRLEGTGPVTGLGRVL